MMSILQNSEGKAIGFICGGGGWGMGITEFPDAIDDEFSSVYGFAMGGDPHDFWPDYECNTPEEIANWEAAKVACKCGR